MLNLGMGSSAFVERVRSGFVLMHSRVKRIVKIKRCDASVMNERVYVKLRMRCQCKKLDVMREEATFATCMECGGAKQPQFFFLCLSGVV